MGIAVLVAKGVELLDVADLDAGLLAHPAAERQLQGAVAGRVEGAERDRDLGDHVRRGHGAHQRRVEDKRAAADAVAAVDLGSNSFHMIVGKLDNKQVEAVIEYIKTLK